MATATVELERTATLEELYPKLEQRHICCGWNKPMPSLYPQPKTTFVPMKWSWEDGKAALDAAGRLISTELAERRNLILHNPVDPNRYATLKTLICAYQMILPGEVARSHRHSPNALRLVLEGEGAYTVVNGERLDMVPNDVLLTPNWHWHGHGSEADGPCYWLDGLDVPLVHMLEPMFFEEHPETYEPIASHPRRSPYIFTWEETQTRLDAAASDAEGLHGRRIELGDPAMTTTGLYMQRMEAGMRTPAMRTTVNQAFCPVEGAGETEIDGTRFAWRRGDVIAVPSWHSFSHSVSADATLFFITDAPLMRMLGWLRSEVVG